MLILLKYNGLRCSWGNPLSHFREIPLPNRDKQFGNSIFRSTFALRNDEAARAESSLLEISRVATEFININKSEIVLMITL